MNNAQFNKIITGKTSEYKGVSWQKKTKKWQVHCYYNGISKYIGLFNTEEDAANEYNRYIETYNLGKKPNLTKKVKKELFIKGVIISNEKRIYKNTRIRIQTFFEDLYEKTKQIWSKKK